ncbi:MULTISPECIES: 3-dehydroquinate synthase [Pseudomonas]|jgi:3-dehydroquinate synthase|uniref:3-dehydroquinate synthase n=1 Tax=Pseudomonas putida TaxID=303 RepID=A0A379KGI2_PSEPU|nr:MULTISPECIES: 3-dehydroquinate synthase [Pseudomonas]QPN45855.1 3-dehydroquinate synthase [Priestia aryabhattai]KAF1311381.1 3-dehydroquinate synthase [Pseudomonas sp. SG-MS2]NWC80360.1 3-dehydroquinate synthase [Pseudomonas putida]SUD66980.1 3-dehydroquinate synthase [Pseudomonas putida]GLH34932.1 3-dehydroquinate synthase [Pseudomonas sp. BR1R-5]
MQTLKVDLGERSYPIYIGEGLLEQPELLAPHIAGRQVAIVSNETVAPLYLERLSKTLGAYSVLPVILPDGEAHKNWETLQLIFDGLLTARHDRRTTVVALGGGVIGDMAGFAAACYQRGVDFIQVPTTLLSQVDSSVGGKTGINHPLGKNMVGAFYQPNAVLIDTTTLNTLPERELSAGLAEVIKYGLICDKPFLGWLEDNIKALRALEPAALTEAIQRSCAAKAAVVGADERESGVRATLNLGHTFGHAIETHMGYGVWLHGEAVAAGTVMALEMSMRLGWIDQSERDRAIRLLQDAGLPVVPPQEMTPAHFMEHMAVDKKVIDGRLRLVLLRQMGEAVVTDDYPKEILQATLSADYRAIVAQL